MPDPASNIIHLPQAIIPPRRQPDPWVVPVLASVIGMGGLSWGLILYGLSALIEKNRFNAARADHKLENRAMAGGKKY